MHKIKEYIMSNYNKDNNTTTILTAKEWLASILCGLAGWGLADITFTFLSLFFTGWVLFYVSVLVLAVVITLLIKFGFTKTVTVGNVRI